jgi:integrase
MQAPLSKVLDAFLTAVEPGNPTLRAPAGLVRTSWVGYEAHARLHIEPYLGDVRIGSLTLTHVEDWLKQLRAAGMSGSMRRKVLTTLRTVLKWAIAHDYLPNGRNVASLAPMPEANQHEWQPIDSNELQAILKAIRGHRLEALFRLALMMGPRLGELNGLALSDFDREARTININYDLVWEGPYPRRKQTKTPKSRRTIALPDSLFATLEAHLERRAQECLAAGDDWEEYGLLFTRFNGRPLRGDGTGGVGDQFKRCLRRAGLPVRNFHQLRHQAASLLLALNGGDYFEVARILGHSTYRLTLDLYGHLIPEVQRRLAESVDRFYTQLGAGVDPFSVPSREVA